MHTWVAERISRRNRPVRESARLRKWSEGGQGLWSGCRWFHRSSVQAPTIRIDGNCILRFHSGKVYGYFEFPSEQYDEFLAADSKGRYFAGHIRGQFRDEEVR